MPNVKVNPVTSVCSPDPVTVQGANQTIVFMIDPDAGNDWSWNPTTPLVITATAGIFTINNPNSQGNILVQDRNGTGDKGTFKYTAMLIKAGAATPVTIDPSIENE